MHPDRSIVQKLEILGKLEQGNKASNLWWNYGTSQVFLFSLLKGDNQNFCILNMMEAKFTGLSNSSYSTKLPSGCAMHLAVEGMNRSLDRRWC